MMVALRILPIAPIIPRACLNDSVLPTGGGPDGTSPMLVRKGDFLYLDTYNLGQDKDIWGEDADEFRPYVTPPNPDRDS